MYFKLLFIFKFSWSYPASHIKEEIIDLKHVYSWMSRAIFNFNYVIILLPKALFIYIFASR